MYNFKENLKRDVELTEKALEQYLPIHTGAQGIVVEAMRYSLLGGGKRLRSSIALEFCAECGGNVQEMLPFACAIEMIHAYSLIHDDLPCMDNDDTRRGKSSCHIAFGETTALLAGDALLTKAFELMLAQKGIAPERVLDATGILASAIGVDGMLGGQVMDLANEGHVVDIETIETTNLLKTGALIRASAKIGCVIGGGGRQTIAYADAYARAIGIAFQITDDILDCTGNQDMLGKPIGSDKSNQKNTYVSAYGIEQAQIAAQNYVNEAKESLDKIHTKSRILYDIADFILTRKK